MIFCSLTHRGAGRGSGRRTGRGRRHRADSAPVHLVSRLAGLVDLVHNATPSPNRNTLGRSGRHGRKQGDGGTLGAGEAIDSPGLARPPRPAGGFFFGLDVTSRGVRSRAFARLATKFAAFAPPLGTVNGLPQRRNLHWGHYRSRSLLDQGRLDRFGSGGASFHELEHCPPFGRDLPSAADAFVPALVKRCRDPEPGRRGAWSDPPILGHWSPGWPCRA